MSFFPQPGKRGKSRRKTASRTSPLPKRLLRRLLVLLFGVFLTATGIHVTTGRVIKVSDGDTITVHTGGGNIEKVRLYGIDAPESRQRGGKEAADFARDMLFFAPVSLTVVNTDQYGRKVALVRLEDGRLANEEMLRAGQAWVYRDYCKELYCAAWMIKENQARKEKRGLWRDKKPTAPWRWRWENR